MAIATCASDARGQSRAPPAPTELDARSLTLLKSLFIRPPLEGTANDTAEQAKIALGRALFHEKQLSSNGAVACATCHDPRRAFSDPRGVSRGVSGIALARNAPSLLGVRHLKLLFWDGRASKLEDQILIPLAHPDEMNSSPDEAAARLNALTHYRQSFALAFPGHSKIEADALQHALSAYERSLDFPQTRFDLWIEGDESALRPQELRGFRLFAGKARCLACHGGWRLTDDRFHDVGLPQTADKGRGAIPDAGSAPHAFRTPSLRQLRWTSPYMHDGSLRSLAAVVEHYASRIVRRPSVAPELRAPLRLSTDEQADVVAFLAAVSADKPSAPYELRK